MNKKEAVAYAQITLEMMSHSTYKGELNLQNFGMEMRQAFKMYPRSIVPVSYTHLDVYKRQVLKEILLIYYLKKRKKKMPLKHKIKN